MSQPIIFLDDGGVMNDNLARGRLWQRLVGEFFVPLLGGTHKDWGYANWLVAERLLDPASWDARLHAATDYASFDLRYQLDWVNWMCEKVGVAPPPEEECYELARRANAYITRQASSPFPGVVGTIRVLYEQGCTLYTASGEASYELDGYLSGMGVRDCFGERLYGSDLIGTFKRGPEYYERLLADLGVAAADALFVDDLPLAVDWAAQVGARAVLISKEPVSQCSATFCLSSLVELPQLLQKLAS